MTTAFEREILTHHFVSDAPFPRDSDLYRRTAKHFAILGLLKLEGFDGEKVSGNQNALRPYMEALAAVPLPVNQWVIPTGE